MALVADYDDGSEESDLEETNPSSNNQLNVAKPVNATGKGKDNSSKAASTESDDVLEDFVKKTNYGEKLPERPQLSSGASKLKLPALKGSRGKVQISIPNLEARDSDDEGEPTNKKPRTGSGRTGFLSFLPAPKNATAGKESGRKLLPHTLTKNKSVSSKPVNIQKSAATIAGKVTSTPFIKPPLNTPTYSDSDDDEGEYNSKFKGPSHEPIDYLGIGSADHPQKHTDPQINSVSSSVPAINKPLSFSGPSSAPLIVTETPLQFNSTNISPSTASGSYIGPTQSSEQYVDSATYQPQYETNAAYQYDDGSRLPSYVQQEEMEVDCEDDVKKLINDEQFLRLQGKKQRGREEINIIDVHTDDQLASELDLTKSISEEADPSMYAHRKKGSGPSSQQKRKHQITYLAFQAKERELELKNTWAANRQTKKQTQAKYGF